MNKTAEEILKENYEKVFGTQKWENAVNRNLMLSFVVPAMEQYKAQSSSAMKLECFCDESYYGLWAVRPIVDRDFNSQTLFHVHSKEEAEALKSLLESISPINGVEEP